MKYNKKDCHFIQLIFNYAAKESTVKQTKNELTRKFRDFGTLSSWYFWLKANVNCADVFDCSKYRLMSHDDMVKRVSKLPQITKKCLHVNRYFYTSLTPSTLGQRDLSLAVQGENLADCSTSLQTYRSNINIS